MNQWALDLAKRVGLEQELLNTNEANRKALIVHRGRLHAVPEGFTLLIRRKFADCYLAALELERQAADGVGVVRETSRRWPR